MFGGSSNNSATTPQAQQAPAVTGLTIQTSVQGIAIPIVWGQCRISGNIIWYDNFQAIATTTVTSTAGGGGGGKGGGGGGGAQSSSSTTFTYTTGIAIAVGEGTIAAILQMWSDRSNIQPGLRGLSDYVDNFYTGAAGQAPDAWLAVYAPEAGLAYANTAYMINPAYPLGTNTSLPSISFEVLSAAVATISTPSGQDCLASQVVADILTNPIYGAGFPAAYLDSLTNFTNYCGAAGFLISYGLDSQQSASTIIQDIVTSCNAAFCNSQGILTIVPYGDTNLQGNGYTYIAPTAPEFWLTDDDYITESKKDSPEPPVKLMRKRPADVYNSVTVEYLDRSNEYNVATVTAWDLASINTYGARPESSQSSHWFCDQAPAMLSAQLLLQRQHVRNTYEFIVGWQFIGLDPMDLIAISDSNLGLVNQLVLITAIEEDEEGALKLTVEESLNGTGSAPIYLRQTNTAVNINYNVLAPPVNAPVLMEVPDLLSNNPSGPEIWMSVSGSNNGLNWGGCDVYLSTDNQTYKKIGSVYGPARYGALTAQLPTTASSPDTTDTLSIALNNTGLQLLSGTQDDATALNTLCWADGELIAYETAMLASPGAYDLSYLVRGAYGSTIGAHSVNSNFARLDTAIFNYQYDPTLIGQYIYIKLVSFNQFGAGSQDISTVPAVQYLIQGLAVLSPLPTPANLIESYNNGFTQLNWQAVSDFRQPNIQYEVRFGSSWLGGQFMGRTPSTSFTFMQSGTYFVSALYISATGLLIYSGTPAEIVISGGVLVNNIFALYDEASSSWAGTVSGGATINSGNLILGASGNILSLTDFLNTQNILWFGGVAAAGEYDLPAGHAIVLAAPAACKVLMTVTASPENLNTNMLTTADFLNYGDVLDWSDMVNIGLQPQIALAQGGGVYGAWQNYIPGIYLAQYFKARLLLSSALNSVYPQVSDITFSVDVPTNVQTGNSISLPSGGSTITYPVPYNINPGTPQVSVLNASAGDQLKITSPSATQFTVQVLNGGTGVARTINWIQTSY